MSEHDPDGSGRDRSVEIPAARPVGSDGVRSALSPDAKYCHACAAVLDARAVVCPKCGIAQRNVEASGTRSRVQAALFALLLGGLGVHKFYLGKPVQGIFYLLFVWTLVPSFIAFIEGLIYLTMSDEKFAQKYG